MFKFLKPKKAKITGSQQPAADSERILGDSSAVILPPAFAKPRSRRRRIVLVTLMLLLVLLAGFIGVLALSGNPDALKRNIVIGDNTVTPGDVEKYTNQQKNYNQISSAGNKTLQEYRQAAIGDLLMNAALKHEAKQRNLQLTPQDLEEYERSRFSTPELLDGYRKYLASNATNEYVKLRTENLIYMKKLEPVLIDKKDLLLVEVPYDTTYHRGKSTEEQKALHSKGIEELQTKFEPQVAAGKPASEIGQQADVFYGHTQPVDADFYKTRLFTYVQEVKGYPGAPDDLITKFNDIQNTKDVIGFTPEDLRDTDDMVALLKNVGDYTPVFASKAGAHMIIRLDGIQKGPYASYQAMLDDYKSKHVLSNMDKLKSLFTKWLNRLNFNFEQAFRVASAAAMGRVYADQPPECAGHDVVFTFIARDAYTWGEVPGGIVVTKDRASGRCGYTGHYEQWTTTGFQENCNQNAPIWGLGAVKPGYTFTGWDWYPGWSAGLNSSAGITSTIWLYPPPPPQSFDNYPLASASPGPAVLAPGDSATLSASITTFTWYPGYTPINSTNPSYLLVRNENPTYILNNGMSGTNSPYGTTHYYSSGGPTYDWVWQYWLLPNPGTITTTFNITVAPNTPPGVYCFQSYAYPNHNYDYSWEAGSRPCVTVVAANTNPFVTTEFGDIHAGTTWGESACLVSPGTDSSPGNIQGQVSGSNGSKADYIISAGGSISGFGSAGDPAGANSNLLKFGGSTGGYGQICRPDIAKRFINDPSSYTALGTPGALYTIADVGSLASGVYYHKGNVEITGTSTIPVGKSITLIVDGTVLIDNNINQGAGNITLNTIPTFGLVATGNINVHENVTHLYGIYNAGSSLAGSIGVINTCQNNHSTTTFSPALKTTNACNNTLVVEGAMIANNIYFRRKPPSSNVTANNNPAERISLIPQLFLRPPVGFSTVSLQLRSEGERPPVY